MQNVVVSVTVQTAVCWVTKIFSILTLGIFKKIMCGKYGPREEFLIADVVSKTLTNNRNRKFQERNLNEI